MHERHTWAIHTAIAIKNGVTSVDEEAMKFEKEAWKY
jgi:hypothetical protein